MFAKSVMDAAMVPTAGFSVCDTPAAAQLAIAEADGNVVVKADGLAAGKGVFVCSSVAEAEAAVKACLIDRRFGVGRRPGAGRGAAGGPEVSLLALCDGETVVRARRRPATTSGWATATPARTPAAWAATRRRRTCRSRWSSEIIATVHRPVVNELARRGHARSAAASTPG